MNKRMSTTSIVVSVSSTFMIFLLFAPIRIIIATDSIPSDILYSYKDYESQYNSYTLTSMRGNNITAVLDPITLYGPIIPDVQFHLMLPPMNFSFCTTTNTVGNNNPNYYSGNYDANVIIKNNNNSNNTITGLLFFNDHQQPLLNNCSFNEIIYNAYHMFQSTPSYLLFPKEYENEFQNEINIASYSIGKYAYLPPTILFVPYDDMKTLATKLLLKENEEVVVEKEEDSMKDDKYYISLTSNTYSNNDQQNENNAADLLIASTCLFCIILLRNHYYNDNDNDNETPQAYTSISGRVITQNVNKKQQQFHLVTYEEFESLPRINYNQFETSYSQRISLMKKSKDEIYLDHVGTTTTTTASDHTDSEMPLAVATTGDIMQQQTNVIESMIDIVVVTECNNENSNDTSNSISTYNINSLDTNDNTHCGGIVVNETCAICIDEFNNHEHVIVLPRCQHIYYIECIRLWLLKQKSNSCPLCKVEVLEQTNNNNNNNNKQETTIIINTIMEEQLPIIVFSENISNATSPITLHLPEAIVVNPVDVLPPMGIYTNADNNVVFEIVVPYNDIETV